MLWFKRNLFLTVTGLTALLLLGGGVFFVMAGRSRNAELDQGVEETRSQLNTTYSKDPFPHTTNIDMAKKESAKLRAEIQKMAKYIAPVPVERVDAREFLALRDRTLSELRDSALRAQVGVPAGTLPYAFSFDVQRAKVGSFGPGTFPTVPEQMAEVKALCAALFEARVSRILNIRRARASSDDNVSTAPVQDYTAGVGISSNANIQAVTHPYEITFTCFSAEIAHVLTSLAKSPYGFIVKAVQVEPDGMQVADAGGQGLAGGEPQAPPPANTPRFTPRPQPPRPGPGGRPLPTPPPSVAPPVAAPPRPAPASANDRPIVLLKERRLRVTMLVYAVRPTK